MFALADMVHLLTDEFTGLSGGGLSLSGILSSALYGFLFRHTPDEIARRAPPFEIDLHQKPVS
jgi:hypothetical protein